MSCIMTISFQILINMVASPFFHAERGLRQGCPLSRPLFLMVAEGLIYFLKHANYSGSFKGLPISQVLYIAHLLFVDDILILCDGSNRDVNKLCQGLDLFKRASGIIINEDRSSITWENLEDGEKRYMVSCLNFQCKEVDEGFKYLGLYLNPNDYEKVDWMRLLAKLEKRLMVWSHRWLSQPSRLVLIKSVLKAIPIYWMSRPWILKGVLEKKRKLCFSFLWRGKKDKQVIPRVHWNRITLPKALGGWGLKNIFLFSKALAVKVPWYLIFTHNLWTEVVQHKYITPRSIFESKYLYLEYVLWCVKFQGLDLCEFIVIS